MRLYKNVLVYAICCTVENECIKDVQNQRCSYFVNDRNTGRDFYIDDDTNWTNDANKKPAVLFPSISDSDTFFTLDNSTTVAPDTPGPPGPPAPPGPLGQCCGRWSSLSVSGKATKLIAYLFEMNYISHVATL
ncbi:unnamed protein product [Bursaphelenchus okinawaensis]|uniref:Uncharacterized protein n=1 Tax=Bursaphelenchus okinawaensis TaxID=465554 RepID=A0A811K395_9BILA|nr:unnamed protein product [Bursaphelenchus okinawaensis]CAG9091013.1 unnamed protein product [Bursaphelenchus okinawaensis]